MESLKQIKDASSTPYESFDDVPRSPFVNDGNAAIAKVESSSNTFMFCVHGNEYKKYGVVDDCKYSAPVKRNDNESGCLDDSKKSTISEGPQTSTSLDNLEHCHIEKETGIDKKARNKLLMASALCLFFMTIEIVGGIWASSLAIATDAAHLLTDLASFMISLVSIWLASRPSTKQMSFGWHRAEVIGATISVLMIWVVTGILVYAAVLRLLNGDFTVNATPMLITSAAGVAINIIMGISLHQPGHAHGGGENNENSNVESGEASKVAVKTQESENINVKAAFIDVIGDFVQSVGVYVASV